MTASASHTLRMTHRFDASAAPVFDAWLEPAMASKWLFTTPGSDKNITEIDARIGGRWGVTDWRDGKEFKAGGEYLEMDRPHRIVFTFGMPQFSAEAARIIVEIKPAASGCLLSLIHERLPWEHHAETERGWSKMFDALEDRLDRRTAYGVAIDGETIRFERVVPGPIERVWAYLTQSDERGEWLAAGEMQPRVGSSFDLHFHHASLSRKFAPTPDRFRKYEHGHVSGHQIIRYEPRRLLSFTWGEGGDAPSEVCFELSRQGDEVLLITTHRRLADRESMKIAASGWHTHLAILIDRLDGREPPSFWTIFAEIDAEYRKRFSANDELAAKHSG